MCASVIRLREPAFNLAPGPRFVWLSRLYSVVRIDTPLHSSGAEVQNGIQSGVGS